MIGSIPAPSLGSFSLLSGSCSGLTVPPPFCTLPSFENSKSDTNVFDVKQFRGLLRLCLAGGRVGDDFDFA